jgi:hypothetical protein
VQLADSHLTQHDVFVALDATRVELQTDGTFCTLAKLDIHSSQSFHPPAAVRRDGRHF